jgi:pimeloyl-ACP methyl ester carboxylesterase
VSPPAAPVVETVRIGHCDFEAKVKVGGSGPPLLYLHGAAGPRWDPFLDALAGHFTVYAPDHPGTGETARDAIYRVESLWDLVLIYDEILDVLGLTSVPVVGSSFGGMMACELASHRRAGVSALVLLDPLGLWREDMPVAPYLLLSQDELLATLFSDPAAPPVQRLLELPADPHELAVAQADTVWSLGATGKFVWPIPDKGLKKRLHRITAPTFILWGEDDRLISAAYAAEFAGRIADSRVEIVTGAGHLPQWEQLEAVVPLVLEFLAGSEQR